MRSVLAALATGLALVASLGCPPTPPLDIPYQPSRAICGNDRQQSGEVCDGSDLDDTTCSQLGYGAGALACKPSCEDFDRSGCGAPSTCGDGTRNGVEICDGADLGGSICESLGRGPGTLRCLPNCGDFDTRGCAPPPDCGDGEINGPAEICDGEDLDNLTCERLGFASGTLRCAADCLSLDRTGCVAGRDAALADTASVDGARPDATAADVRFPDSAGPDGWRPDSWRPDSAPPDHARQDTWRADTVFVPDSAVIPDAWGPADGGATALTVYDIQDPYAYQRPLLGTWVQVSGVVVTAVDGMGTNHGFWVQEPAGGKYSGIYVYKTEADPFDVTTLWRGDVVTVTGLYLEYFDLSELQLYSVVKTGSRSELLPQVVYDLASDPEGWEGVLVRVEPDCQLTQFYAYGEVQTTCARLDNELYLFSVELGWSYAFIAGVWHYSFDNYKLLPRDALDFGALIIRDAGSVDIW